MISVEQAYKPSSVLDSHLSRTAVACCLKQHTRERGGPPHMLSYLPCSRWGLQSQPVTWLLVSSYLAFPPLPLTWRYISVALSSESPPLGVTQHPALWSSDFPRARARDYPACSFLWIYFFWIYNTIIFLVVCQIFFIHGSALRFCM